MTVLELRKMLGDSRQEFSDRYGIPIRTIQNWELGSRTPPDYFVALLERAVREDLADGKAGEGNKGEFSQGG